MLELGLPTSEPCPEVSELGLAMVFRACAEILLEVVEEGMTREGGGVRVRGGEGDFGRDVWEEGVAIKVEGKGEDKSGGEVKSAAEVDAELEEVEVEEDTGKEEVV